MASTIQLPVVSQGLSPPLLVWFFFFNHRQVTAIPLSTSHEQTESTRLYKVMFIYIQNICFSFSLSVCESFRTVKLHPSPWHRHCLDWQKKTKNIFISVYGRTSCSLNVLLVVFVDLNSSEVSGHKERFNIGVKIVQQSF